MNKMYFSSVQVNGMVHDIIRQMIRDNFKPDYVVGITRGGLNPALMISHYLSVPLETLNVSLRDGGECEINAWMPDDAFGYIPSDERELCKSRWDIYKRKNILIVDDINDTGATFEWIKNDWMTSCLPDEKEAWDSIWGHNVKFAVLVDNASSKFDVDYYSQIINKGEEDVWCVFPWEEWWK